MSSPTRVGSIVTRNSSLRQLLRQASANDQLVARIRSLLEPALRDHVHGAVLRDSNLVIHADTSAWAAKIRYAIAALKRELDAIDTLPPVKNIRIKVAPADAVRVRETRRQQPLGREAAAAMRDQAGTIEDVTLREALLRIADHDSKR